MANVAVPFVVNPELSNTITAEGFITSVLSSSFRPGASPAIACSIVCLQYVTCVSFFLKISEGNCRLHGNVIINKTILNPENGWKYYTMPARLPGSCAEVRSCGAVADGHFWIQPNTTTSPIRLYCHQLQKEYISLDKSVNYFEEKVQYDGCNGIVQMRTRYSKISINIETLQVDRQDTTFAEKIGGNYIAFGISKDCSHHYGLSCIRPYASINLLGTGFKLSENTAWRSHGYIAGISDFNRNQDNTVVTFSCSGYCGKCLLDSELFLEIIEQQDPVSMDPSEVVHCRG